MEERGLNVSPDDIFGLMVKIKDEVVGEVNENVDKCITNRDVVLLSEGASVAGAILAEAGADPSTFVSWFFIPLSSLAHSSSLVIR